MRNQFIACFTLLFALQSCSVLTDINNQSHSIDSDNSVPASVNSIKDSLTTVAAETLDLPATAGPEFAQFSCCPL